MNSSELDSPSTTSPTDPASSNLASSETTPTNPAVRDTLLSSARVGWTVLLFCLVLQLLVTRENFVRDIEGLYTFSFDQGMYLMHAYDSFEALRNGGLSSFMTHTFGAPDRPTGVLVQGEAALLYGLFGASRTTSLMVLFLHFALFQVVLFATVRKVLRRNDLGFLAIGLLLATSTRFFWAGGLNDFRLDFAASCLYGISLCALIASDLFSDLKWTVAFIGSLVVLFGSRFVSISFTMIGLAIIVGYIVIRELRRKSKGEALFKIPIVRRALLVLTATPILTYPIMSSNIVGLLNYYIIGHIVSPEKKLRAAEVGVATLTDAILFYPTSLLKDHLGFAFSILAAFAIAVGLGIRFAFSDKANASEQRTVPFLGSAVLATIVWLAAPLALFTADESKSPVVAGLLVGPALLLVLCALIYLVQLTTSSDRQDRSSRIWIGLSLAVFLAGGGYSFLQQVRRFPNLETARQATDLYRLFDIIAEDARANDVRSLKFATDRVLDYFNGIAAKVMIYERNGKLVDTEELLANGLMARPKEQALAAVDAADYVLITLDAPAIDRGGLPFNVAMLGYKKELLARAESQMLPVKRLQVGEHAFVVFSRPKLKITGESGEWLPSQGAGLKIEGRSMSFGRHIVLSGPTMLSKYLKGKLTCRAFLKQMDREALELKTVSIIGNDEYAIAIDASTLPADLPSPIQIGLEFSTYFVPQEVGLNVDTRKLVVLAPRSIRLTNGPADYPPLLKSAAK